MAKISNSFHSHPPISIDRRTSAAKKAKKMADLAQGKEQTQKHKKKEKQKQKQKEKQQTTSDPLEWRVLETI